MMEIKQIKIEEIKEYEKNTKKHPKDQIKKIADSIENFGFNVPLILTKDNVLIAGHGRFKAAQKLGLRVVPVIFKEDLTEEQIKAYRIADNKTAESEWDFDFLKEELDFLQKADFNLDLTGFDDGETSKIFKLKEVEDVNILEERFNVITVNPPEAPKLKERYELCFETKEGFDKFIKEYADGKKINTKKVLKHLSENSK